MFFINLDRILVYLSRSGARLAKVLRYFCSNATKWSKYLACQPPLYDHVVAMDAAKLFQGLEQTKKILIKSRWIADGRE